MCRPSWYKRTRQWTKNGRGEMVQKIKESRSNRLALNQEVHPDPGCSSPLPPPIADAHGTHPLAAGSTLARSSNSFHVLNNGIRRPILFSHGYLASNLGAVVLLERRQHGVSHGRRRFSQTQWSGRLPSVSVATDVVVQELTRNTRGMS